MWTIERAHLRAIPNLGDDSGDPGSTRQVSAHARGGHGGGHGGGGGHHGGGGGHHGGGGGRSAAIHHGGAGNHAGSLIRADRSATPLLQVAVWP